MALNSEQSKNMMPVVDLNPHHKCERLTSTLGAEDPTTKDFDEQPRPNARRPFVTAAGPNKSSSLALHELAYFTHTRKASLLTQAFLTTPTHKTQTSHLSSPSKLEYTDKVNTSLEETLPPIQTEACMNRESPQEQYTPLQIPSHHPTPKSKLTVEESLGRRRCVSFACGKAAPLMTSAAAPKVDSDLRVVVSPTQDPAKRRTCHLKFACPAVPLRNTAQRSQTLGQAGEASRLHTRPQPRGIFGKDKAFTRPLSEFSFAEGNQKTCAPALTATLLDEVSSQSQAAGNALQREMCHFGDDDAWTRENAIERRKMTISDTLVKENAIRSLADEAEQEAQDDEIFVSAASARRYDDRASDDDNVQILPRSRLNAYSDDGNESDDEASFTTSDNGSDDGFIQGFWTPGLTTAATSTDHLDHIRVRWDGKMPESSDDSLDVELPQNFSSSRKRNNQCIPERRRSPFRGNGTHLDEFIIGTLDEDRARHEAFLSTFEEHKRSKQRIIPQDIDPSFPTSDPEDENDSDSIDEEDDDDDDEEGDDIDAKEEGKPWAYSQDTWLSTQSPASVSSAMQEPLVSSQNPGRAHRNSPSPFKREPTPPPRRLFRQHYPRLRSPPPPLKRLCSPPPSRRPSPTNEPLPSRGLPLDRAELAQKPNLIGTSSLPRSENPFWNQHRSRKLTGESNTALDLSLSSGGRPGPDMHNRGPIDIVLGLEHKRQRRREKYWRVHCQKAHAGKEKERKCHRGKGVARMREVGMVMQDRFRGYGQVRPNLMLSI